VKKTPPLPKSPYTLAVTIKKGTFCPMEGRPFIMKITIKNISKKTFPKNLLEYVFVTPSPFKLSYSWTKLEIPQLKEDEEVVERIFYYGTTSGIREIRLRATDKSVGLYTTRGKTPMFGNLLIEPFRVYSWTELVKLTGAIFAIVGAITGIIMLLLSILG